MTRSIDAGDLFGLLERFRRLQYLEFSASRAIHRDVALERLQQPTAIDEGEVAAAEAELDCRLPDQVLALFAAHVPRLERSMELWLEQVPYWASYGAEHWRIPATWVCFGYGPERSDRYHLIGFRRGVVTGDCPVRECAGYVGQPLELRFEGHLAQWVESLLVERHGEDAMTRPLPEADDLPAFAPHLLASRKTPERVRHRQWGVGEVLRRSGDKITARFETVGEKTVLARFVEIV